MSKAFSQDMPKIAYVFGDLTGGGHNLQAFKTIVYSGAINNCIAVSIFSDSDESLEQLLDNNHIKLYKLNLNKLSFLKAIKQIKQIVKLNECSIVHSNGLKADTICHFAFHKTSIRHIITLHNYLKEDIFLRKGKIYSSLAVFIQSYVLSKTKYIISCSKTLKKQMLIDNPKLKITAIQNGVDTDRFISQDKENLRKKNGVDLNTVIFISTGRINPRKRIIETGDAFVKANLSENYHLWFVGNGECYDEYKNKYSNYKSIKFLGRRNDIAALLSMADIFVSSSETEGLPLAVLEALATGKKVFLSDIPQHKEILDEFPSGGVLYHLGNKEELVSLFLNARKYIDSDESVSLCGTSFDINVMGKEYARYYRNVLFDGKEAK